jgi:hypothetical protein
MGSCQLILTSDEKHSISYLSPIRVLVPETEINEHGSGKSIRSRFIIGQITCGSVPVATGWSLDVSSSWHLAACGVLLRSLQKVSNVVVQSGA